MRRLTVGGLLEENTCPFHNSIALTVTCYLQQVLEKNHGDPSVRVLHNNGIIIFTNNKLSTLISLPFPNTTLTADGPQRAIYGHTFSKSMDQPGKVTNLARGRLNSKK